MTLDERVVSISAFGFTNRQARFLVTVMQHSGVCLSRQYCAFAGVVRGQKVHNFFSRLLARGFATAFRCPRYGTRIYHLQHKPMYAAIGQAGNRNRRAITLAHALPRLMLLDAVLGSREDEWVGTESDKLARFAVELRIEERHLPALSFDGADGTRTTRFFPDKLPIGLRHENREHIFLYLAKEQLPTAFRIFLRRHAALLQRLPRWTVRVLMPPSFSQAGSLYRGAFLDEYGSPLRPAIVEELRWYFIATASPRGRSPTPDERFERASRAFRAPRFRSLYRAWQVQGDPVLDSTLSHVLKASLDRSVGRLEIVPITRRYDHLSTRGEGAWF